jgi:hypothetical protein
MDVTNRYQTLRELTDSQIRGLDVLVAGGTHAEAAEAAGVHRVTVSRWASKHPAFRAEMNRMRKELLDQRTDRIRKIDALALEIIARRVEDQDEAAAMQWVKLRRLGVADVSSIGPTTYDRLIDGETAARVSAIDTQDLTDMLTKTSEAKRSAIRDAIQDEYLDELSE